MGDQSETAARLFFFHLPKAGGTSLTEACAGQFAPHQIAPNLAPYVRGLPLGRETLRAFTGFDFYAGHYGVDLYSQVEAGHRTVANFRHPVARVHSLYRFFHDLPVSSAELEQPHFAAVRAAKQLSFAEFVRSDDERILIYISNQQARQFTGSPWRWSDEIQVAYALAWVDRLSCLYVCEEPETSIAWLRATVSLSAVPRLNVTSVPEDEDEMMRSADVILARNGVDTLLYNRAVQRLTHWRTEEGSEDQKGRADTLGTGFDNLMREPKRA